MARGGTMSGFELTELVREIIKDRESLEVARSSMWKQLHLLKDLHAHTKCRADVHSFYLCISSLPGPGGQANHDFMVRVVIKHGGVSIETWSPLNTKNERVLRELGKATIEEYFEFVPPVERTSSMVGDGTFKEVPWVSIERLYAEAQKALIIDIAGSLAALTSLMVKAHPEILDIARKERRRSFVPPIVRHLLG